MTDKTIKFCSNCDYAIDQEILAFMRCELPCPRCGRTMSHSGFYSIGSQTHRERRESWLRGEIKGNPPPFKE